MAALGGAGSLVEGLLASVSAELANLNAQLAAVGAEISDAKGELRAAQASGDAASEWLMRAVQALHDKEKLLNQRALCVQQTRAELTRALLTASAPGAPRELILQRFACFCEQPLDPAHAELLVGAPAFKDDRAKLVDGTFQVRDVRRLLLRLRSFVASATRDRIHADCGLVLVGPVPGASGQADVAVLHALDGSAVRCVKVMTAADAEREMAISCAVHASGTWPTVLRALACETLPPYKDGGARAALVMPPLHLTLTSALLALPPGPSHARDVLALNTAVCCLAAVHAFASAGFAHGDIKPSNLMLTSAGLVLLIDFGTARRVGESFAEGSAYGLDAPALAGAAYDLTSLGAVLADAQHEINIAGGSAARVCADVRRARAAAPWVAPASALAEQCLQPGASSGQLRAAVDAALLTHCEGQHGSAAGGALLWRDVRGVVSVGNVFTQQGAA